MAAALLNCSVCPSHPTFSDTSHLLTHVSSKAHLSNLHKLQVRSHQEIGAGHELAIYNQWYQRHELGRLLSERMLQKESKKTIKRRRTFSSPKKIKKEGTRHTAHVALAGRTIAVDPRLQQTPSIRPARRSKVTTGSILQSDHMDSGLESSPIKQRTKRKARRRLPSSTKRSSSDAAFDIPGHNRQADIDLAILDSPESSKLKGVLWPGMHLFDAATAEMRRRRNQKKDGSALMQMEKTSQDVQPTEVIYSEGWTSIKQRPITGMVEESSPLKGESPLPRKPVRRKRPALTEISANVLRPAGKSVKLEHSEVTHRRHSIIGWTDQGFPSLLSSSNGTSLAAKSRYSPTEDETMEFKLTVGNLVNRKRGGNITIFHDKEDANPYQVPNATAGQWESAYSQFPTTDVQSHLPQAGTQVSLTTPFWLQPQCQQIPTHRNLYLTGGSSNPSYYTHHHVEPNKENVDPWFYRTSQVEQRHNPLGWNHHAALVQSPYDAYNNFGYNVQVGVSGLRSQDDMFGHLANPLLAGYQTLEDQLDSSFEPGETARLPLKPFDAKKGSVSPDGTVSEQDEQNYDQSAFNTSE